MPQLHLPFPAHDPNPAHPQAQAALDTWLDVSGICQSPASRASLERTRIPLVTALAYPDAGPAALELLARWAAWTFIIDDQFDDGPDGQDPSRCADALATFLPVLDGQTPGGTPPARAFAATLQDLTAGRSAGFDRMLRSDIAAFLWSYYQGLVDQGSGRLPTMAAYRRQRGVTVGAYTWLAAVEIAAGIDLPETVRHFSSFQDLRDAAAQYAGLHNDLWSLQRDKAAGAFHNAVLLVQHHDRLALQEAINAVHAMLTDCVERMQDAERDLAAQLDAARITGPARDDVLTCAAGYRKFVRGCFDYHSQTRRYTAPPAAEGDIPPHRLIAPTRVK
ncbi:terpene synthase family protein [Streptomyces sp. NPDC023588]|uniref:terpene synthase family protein n=1 Tax=Streptomyces sp. NPDC023588 TaxID=3154907 RepID=UPI003401A9B2